MSYTPISTKTLSSITHNIQENSPHPSDVTIIAVTKKFPHFSIINAIKNNITCIGENQIQEFEEKHKHLSKYTFEAHLIGHLQSNKINKAIKLFNIIQTIDSIKLAQALNERLKRINKKQNIYIQLNIGNDPKKYGFHTKNILQQIEFFLKLQNLNLKGVMAILPFLEDVEDTQKLYAQTRKIQQAIMQKITPTCTSLSMGMSRDYIYALKEGSTHIRLGTNLYGPRP